MKGQQKGGLGLPVQKYPVQRIEVLYRERRKQCSNSSMKLWYLDTRNDTRNKGNKNNCSGAWTEYCVFQM